MISLLTGKWMREILKKSNGLIKVKNNLVFQNLDGQSSVPSLRTIFYRLKKIRFSGLKEIFF